MTDASLPTDSKPKKSKRPTRKKIELKGRLPRTVPGKAAKGRIWTPEEAQAEAEKLHASNRSFERNAVVEMLYGFIAMSEEQVFQRVTEQIAITESYLDFTRTLRDYRKLGVISELSIPVMQKAAKAGLAVRRPHLRLRAYTLGPVGERLAKRMFGKSSRPAVNDGGDEHRMHDLLCTEIMHRMREAWAARKVRVTAKGTREAAVWQGGEEGKGGKFVLVPDGLLIKHKNDTEIDKAYLVEFHNAPAGGTARRKIKAYEAIGKPTEANQEIWREAWGVSEMPYVMVIYRHAETLRQYQAEFEKTYSDIEPRCSYLSLDLNEVWNGNPLSIKPLRVRKEKKG